MDVCFCAGSFAQAAYYGQPLGHLSSLHHGVSGEVFAVDARTLHIRDFTYDGEGPAAYFYVGDTKTPSGPGGVRLNDEKGSWVPIIIIITLLYSFITWYALQEKLNTLQKLFVFVLRNVFYFQTLYYFPVCVDSDSNKDGKLVGSQNVSILITKN